MWWLIPLVAFFLLVLVLLVRAWRFQPAPAKKTDPTDLAFSAPAAVNSLQQLLQLPTVSSARPEQEDETAFARVLPLLRELFPALHKTCHLHKLGRRGLLYHWPGKAREKPIVLMAHYDVVPAAAELWRQPPFAGVIADGHLWGRGALDTKLSFNSILQAVETLLGQDFVPEQDIYLAFGGNEEVMGPDAPAMVAWFEEHKIQPAFVFDEGGAIVSGIFPGVHEQCAVIGTGEKGIMTVEFVHKSSGGHSSTPPARSSLARLARACLRVEARPLKRQLTAPIKEMFDTLGRHSSFAYRLVFANLWLFAGLLDKFFQKKGGELNALIRTTVAFTQASGSSQTNVLPTRAVLGANLRLISGDTCDQVLQELKKRVDDPAIEVNPVSCQEASPVSVTDQSPYWQRLKASVQAVWPGTLVSPFLMIGASDSRHYCRICDQVYRFSPMVLSDELRATIHGNDERVPLKAIEDGVRFYLELISRS